MTKANNGASSSYSDMVELIKTSTSVPKISTDYIEHGAKLKELLSISKPIATGITMTSTVIPKVGTDYIESATRMNKLLPTLNPKMAQFLKTNTKSVINMNTIMPKANIEYPTMTVTSFKTPDFTEINKEKKEKRERELEMIELLRESNELARKTHSNSTYITGGNVQQIFENSTGTQIINQSGLDISAILSLTKELKEIFTQLPPIEQVEGNEIIDTFVEEVKKPTPKKSILKMCSKTIIDYLKNPVILLNAITTVSEKAPILIDKIQKLIG